MIFIFAILMGMVLACAGQIGKLINSATGTHMTNEKTQAYLTLLGKLSNAVIPIVLMIITSVVQGLGLGLGSGILMALGAFIIGWLRPIYPYKLLAAVFGVPVVLVGFILSLGSI